MKKYLIGLIGSIILSMSVYAQISNPGMPGNPSWGAPGAIGATTPSSGNFTFVTANKALTGSTTGAFSYGTLPYTDTGLAATYQGSVAGYFQLILNNTSNGATASSDIVVGNNLNTATTYYGNFGMNSSAFTGTGIFNAPSTVYLTATSGELGIGTTTANGIHFCVNTCATDNLAISSGGVLSGSAISNFMLAPGAIGSTTPSTGAFTTLAASGTLTATGTVSMSPASNSVTISPTATGTVTIAPSTAGSINNMSIGQTTAAPGTFTTLTATGATVLSGGINSTAVGNKTPSTGAFTTLSTTGLYSPSSTVGIKGTVAADNAQAGSVGEFITSSATLAPTTTNTAYNVTSISLTAGDWEVTGAISEINSGTTGGTLLGASISATSATQAAAPYEVFIATEVPSVYQNGGGTLTTGRVNISSTTTYYCVATVTYGSAAPSVTCALNARRVR